MRFAIDGWNPAKPSPVGNENFDVLADLDGSNDAQTRYIRGDRVDEIDGRVDYVASSWEQAWTLTDRLGSVRDVIDSNGDLLDSLNYDGFGNIDDATELDPEYRGRYGWTGRELDVETQLQYNRARYYDAVTGRWISQDPLGFDAGDSNLYRYVHNAPTNSTDPSGRFILVRSPVALMRLMELFEKADVYVESYRVNNDPDADGHDLWYLRFRGIPFTDSGVKNFITLNKGKRGIAEFAARWDSADSHFLMVDVPAANAVDVIANGVPMKRFTIVGSNLAERRVAGDLKSLATHRDSGEVVGGPNQLLIPSPYGTATKGLIEEAKKWGTTVPYDDPADGPKNLAELADVINKATKNGKNKFRVITIEGHCGGSDRTPGLCFQDPEAKDKGEGWRFDLEGLQTAGGKKAVAAIKDALRPNGYLRLMSCGYEEAWLGKRKDWTGQVDNLSKVLTVPTMVSRITSGYQNPYDGFIFFTRNNGKLPKTSEEQERWYSSWKGINLNGLE